MNENQVVDVLKIVNVAYPKFYKDAEKKAAVKLWTLMFAGDDFENVLLAVQSHIATNKFPPSIADIREAITDVKQDSLTAVEAWGIVQKAIGRYGYSRGEEALHSMPKDLADYVKRFGWRDLCMGEEKNKMADRAHFIKGWESELKQSKKSAMLPEGLVKKIEKKRSEMISIGDMISLADYEEEEED